MEKVSRRDQEERRWDRLTQILLTAHGLELADGQESDSPVDDAEVDFDYSAVDWDENASVDEWERMQRALADPRVTVSGVGEDEDTVPDVAVPDVEFDREWT